MLNRSILAAGLCGFVAACTPETTPAPEPKIIVVEIHSDGGMWRPDAGSGVDAGHMDAGPPPIGLLPGEACEPDAIFPEDLCAAGGACAPSTAHPFACAPTCGAIEDGRPVPSDEPCAEGRSCQQVRDAEGAVKQLVCLEVPQGHFDACFDVGRRSCGQNMFCKPYSVLQGSFLEGVCTERCAADMGQCSGLSECVDTSLTTFEQNHRGQHVECTADSDCTGMNTCMQFGAISYCAERSGECGRPFSGGTCDADTLCPSLAPGGVTVCDGWCRTICEGLLTDMGGVSVPCVAGYRCAPSLYGPLRPLASPEGTLIPCACAGDTCEAPECGAGALCVRAATDEQLCVTGHGICVPE